MALSVRNCTRCKQIHYTDKKTCEKCRKYRIEQRLRRKDNGICIECGTFKSVPGYTNCIKCKNRRILKKRERRKKLKDEVFAAYGGYVCKCPGCRCAVPEFMQIDHIDGNGSQDRKQVKLDKITLYEMLKRKNYPHGYQPFCANCNVGKRTNKKCPLDGTIHN